MSTVPPTFPVAAKTTLPTSTEARKQLPLATGLLDYFPAALAEVARLSKVGNDKHNPGEDLHWARGKSMDHADTIVRHLVERGTVDTDGVRHSAKVAWRALALLQEELEREEGAPMPRGARLTVTGNGIADDAPAIRSVGTSTPNVRHRCGLGSVYPAGFDGICRATGCKDNG